MSADADPMPPGGTSRASAESLAVGENIKALREAAGLNYKAFVAGLTELGHVLHPDSASRNEHGLRECTVADIIHSARLLGVRPAVLLEPAVGTEIEELQADLIFSYDKLLAAQEELVAQRRQHNETLVVLVRDALAKPVES